MSPGQSVSFLQCYVSLAHKDHNRLNVLRCYVVVCLCHILGRHSDRVSAAMSVTSVRLTKTERRRRLQDIGENPGNPPLPNHHPQSIHVTLQLDSAQISD